MERYGSPPRWRGWVDGPSDASSPQRAVSPGGADSYSFTPGVGYRNEGVDENAGAVATMEAGVHEFRRVVATTDASTWAWAKPLWAAMFQTASALSQGPASPWAADTLYGLFSALGSELPCAMCAEHFRQSLHTFPRGHLTRDALTQWTRQLKAEVDERARRRRMGLDQGGGARSPATPPSSPPPTSAAPPSPSLASVGTPPPRQHTSYAPAYAAHPSPPPPQQQQQQQHYVTSSPQPQYHYAYAAASSSPPQQQQQPMHHPQQVVQHIYRGYPAGSPPRQQQQHAAHPQGGYASAPNGGAGGSPHRTAWAELQDFNHRQGLCAHGSLTAFCDHCTNGQGSPVRSRY